MDYGRKGTGPGSNNHETRDNKVAHKQLENESKSQEIKGIKKIYIRFSERKTSGWKKKEREK